MAAQHTARAILASQSLGAGSSVNGTEVDNTAGYGLLVTGRCTNGATGPTLPCQMSVYVGNASGQKYLYQTVAFDLGNNAVSDRAVLVPAEAMYVNVTFTGNTGQAVTVQCDGQQTTGL